MSNLSFLSVSKDPNRCMILKLGGRGMHDERLKKIYCGYEAISTLLRHGKVILRKYGCGGKEAIDDNLCID